MILMLSRAATLKTSLRISDKNCRINLPVEFTLPPRRAVTLMNLLIPGSDKNKMNLLTCV